MNHLIALFYAFSIIGGGKLEWKNDGYCDDLNNNADCEHDSGDCCGVYSDWRFCLECKCISKHTYTVVWLRSWNFIVSQVNFNSFLNPNEPSQRIFL